MKAGPAMANRTFYPVQQAQHGAVVVHGLFKPAGTGAPTGLRGKGVKSVARTGAGLFTITLDDKYVELLGANITVGITGDATDLYAQIGDVDLDAKTIKLRLMTGATPTDLAANANNRVAFVFWLSNTKVP